jgi:hypothetical protein
MKLSLLKTDKQRLNHQRADKITSHSLPTTTMSLLDDLFSSWPSIVQQLAQNMLLLVTNIFIITGYHYFFSKKVHRLIQ